MNPSHPGQAPHRVALVARCVSSTSKGAAAAEFPPPPAAADRAGHQARADPP
jgi:hypothetical protein